MKIFVVRKDLCQQCEYTLLAILVRKYVDLALPKHMYFEF